VEESFAVLQETENREVDDSGGVEERLETASNDDAESDSGSDLSDIDYDELPSCEILVAVLNKTTGKDEYFRALLDSGTTRSLGTEEAIERAGLKTKTNRRKRKYKTAVGIFGTTQRARFDLIASLNWQADGLSAFASFK